MNSASWQPEGVMPLVSGETKVCPVCDSVIDADARRCAECKTDLSLFDVGAEGIPETRSRAGDGKSIDDILESIVAGKNVRPDIFEEIKTIATKGPSEDDILAGTQVPTGAEFECPNCGSRVAATAKVCPGCGAHFADEAVEQFECPLCGAVVDVEAKTCPNCGVAFAEDADVAEKPPAAVATPQAQRTSGPGAVADLTIREASRPAHPARVERPALMERLSGLVESRGVPPEEPRLDRAAMYKELPRLVNDVKPLLLTARKVGVEIGAERDLISEAIAHGKKRDVQRAIALIRSARFQLEREFTSQLAKRIEGVLGDAERARASGVEVGAIVQLCTEAIDALVAKDFVAVGERVQDAREEFEARAGGAAKVQTELTAVRELAANAKGIGLSLREVDVSLNRGEAAIGAKNYDEAAGCAVQARQALMKALPDALTREMKRARTELLDLKVKGGDLTKPVGHLKQASIHMKREEYADAVRFVRMFRQEMGPA